MVNVPRTTPQPAVTVVVVSDYASSTRERSWADEHRCLMALAAQTTTEPFEVVISESAEWESEFPAKLLAVAPNTRVVFSAVGSSYGLKNAGVRAGSAPITVVLDADCQMAPNWISLLLETMRRHPEVSVVSGRTVYEGDSAAVRILALVTRSYLDPGHEGETRFIANNAAGFRTDVLRQHPLPEALGPFSARVQSESLLSGGYKLWFDPRLRVVHEFEGWRMEADIRRNIGYGTVATRLAHPELPYASLVRSGMPSIPLIWLGKLINSWGDCFRCAPSYGVRWFELPLALATSVAVNLMEVPGMIAGYRKQPIRKTAYR